jgi:protein phosphatase 2C family protein 2/3
MDQIFAGCHSNKGKNEYNEDRTVILKPMEEDKTSFFFAVYDGHGGTAASTFCQKHLHSNVVTYEKYATNKKEAFIEGYKQTDKKFLKKMEDCGTTAVSCLIYNDGKKILVANAGDSRCILASGGKAIAISEDHKPANANEKKRIKDAEHTVEIETVLVDGKRHQISRVDGQIAVSRAIGDGDFKDGDGPAETQAITCVPDVYERDVNVGKDQFLVLACDGVWDVMENQEVVDFINKLLSKAKVVTDELLNQISEQLTNHAVNTKGSPDNVTVVIVVLPKKPKK